MAAQSGDHQGVVNVPDAGDLGASIRLSADLERYRTLDQVIFDFGQVEFASPGWMLLVAKTLRAFRQRNPAVRCRAVGRSNTAAMRYAAHAGFFEAFGFELGSCDWFSQTHRGFSSCFVREDR